MQSRLATVLTYPDPYTPQHTHAALQAANGQEQEGLPYSSITTPSCFLCDSLIIERFFCLLYLKDSAEVITIKHYHKVWY